MQISNEVLEPTIKLIYRGFNAIKFHPDYISNGGCFFFFFYLIDFKAKFTFIFAKLFKYYKHHFYTYFHGDTIHLKSI